MEHRVITILITGLTERKHRIGEPTNGSIMATKTLATLMLLALPLAGCADPQSVGEGCSRTVVNGKEGVYCDPDYRWRRAKAAMIRAAIMNGQIGDLPAISAWMRTQRNEQRCKALWFAPDDPEHAKYRDCMEQPF